MPWLTHEESGLDLPGDATRDAGPCGGRQHDEALELSACPCKGVLPFLTRGRLVLGQEQQVLGPRQPLLFVCGEVTAASANRLSFGDLERADVLVHGVAVFQLRVPVAYQVPEPFG